MFCLTLLISITLVACGSDNKENNEDINNTDNTNTNTEEQLNTNAEENEEPDNEIVENEELDTNAEDNAGPARYDFEPNGENIVTLESVQNGVTMKLTYKAEGDKVIEQTADNILPYESIGVTTAEEAEAILAEAVAGYQGVEGITYNIDYQEDQAIETLTMNYEEIDMDTAAELTGVILEGDVSQGISLKRSVDMLLEQGFEIVD